MSDFKVCFIANKAINYLLEGHNIGSVRLINSAKICNINHEVITLEEDHTNEIDNYHIIKMLKSTKRKTSFFPQINEILKSYECIKTATEINCDIIHLLNVNKEIMSFFLKKMKKDKLSIIHLFHSEMPFYNKLNFKIRLQLIKKGFYNNIFVTNKGLQKFLNKTTNKKGEIKYVPCPIDINRYDINNKIILRNKNNIPKDGKVILYVGQIDYDRGFFDVLKAYKKLLKIKENIYLYICHPNLKQENDYYKKYLVKYFKDDSKKIIFSGPIDPIEEIYLLSDIILLPFKVPYWATAPPLVVPEAMASGNPVVTSPLDAIPELNYNNSLFFIKPGDISNIVESIITLVEDVTLNQNIGRNARKYIDREFSMKSVGNKLNKSYEEIINSRNLIRR